MFRYLKIHTEEDNQRWRGEWGDQMGLVGSLKHLRSANIDSDYDDLAIA